MGKNEDRGSGQIPVGDSQSTDEQVEEGERRGLVYEARKILRELGKGTEWKRMDGVNTDMRREQMKRWFRAREIEEWKRWSAGKRMYAKIKQMG